MTFGDHTRRQRDPVTGKLFRVLGPIPRLTPPPKPLRQRRVHFDNLALVTASTLPLKQSYQQLANQLPKGQVLIVLPSSTSPQRRIIKQVAARIEALGHPVTMIEQEAVVHGSV